MNKALKALIFMANTQCTSLILQNQPRKIKQIKMNCIHSTLKPNRKSLKTPNANLWIFSPKGKKTIVYAYVALSKPFSPKWIGFIESKELNNGSEITQKAMIFIVSHFCWNLIWKWEKSRIFGVKMAFWITIKKQISSLPKMNNFWK